MKLRTHTIPLPTDYVSELRNSAQRKKSRCFIEYFYDMEVENAVEALTSLLEPVMVVGIGGIVGSIVIGMYLPIFTVINQLR